MNMEKDPRTTEQTARPRPLLDETNAPFWQACAGEDGQEPRLLLQVCGGCGAVRCPPAPCCPACGSGDYGWREASGRAALWSWNRFHKAYLPGFDPPYCTILAKLAEGPVIVSALAEGEPDQLPPDQPLQVVFRQGLSLFVPVAADATTDAEKT